MEPHYEQSAADGVFTLTFRATKQLLLHSEYEQMVWDECLRRAHAAGHIPVGPIHIEATDLTGTASTPTALIEGESLGDRMRRWATYMGRPDQVDVIQVTASVQIGISL